MNSLQVIRGGRTIKISIFDIVVGDVIPLKIGDQVSLYGILSLSGNWAVFFVHRLLYGHTQVPADGVLFTGHSLAIDESSMTGESKIVCFIYFLSTKLLVINSYDF